MKYLASFALVLLVGCSSMQTATPTAHLRPQASMVTTPRVEFMGDDQIIGLVNYVSNPLWSCTTCAQGQTSTALLAEVPAVIARHPDIVVILTGAWDLIDDPEDVHYEPTVNNIETMCDQFVAAGINPLVFTLPESDAYDAYYINLGLGDVWAAGLIPHMLFYPVYPDKIVQFTDGVDFSQAGLALVYPLAYQQIEAFGVGGLK